MKIELDMYQTLAVAVLVLMLGKFLRARVQVLERFCIPAPVIGGVLFAIFTCVCYVTGVAEFAFDDILKEVCMVMFFTSVGFQANLKVLKSGGRAMIVFLGVVIVLIVSQNFVAVGLAKLLGVDALVGLCTGSIPMVGGHGTAGAFGPVLEDFGIQGATTLCTAAATYGLIAGSMMGGPIGKMLIERHNLLATVVPEDDSLLVEEEMKHERHTTMYPAASFQLIVAMGIGTVLSRLLSLTGMTFPIYIGAMIAAAIIRNVGEYSGQYTVYMGEINDIGGICLSLFLGMAMITLKLWQLAELALPLIVLLAGQTLFGYPFLCESVSSVFLVLGAGLKTACMLPQIVALFAVFGMGWQLARRILGSHVGKACLAYVLFFLGSGFGFVYFFGGKAGNFTRIFTAFYETPTNYVEENVRWVNPIADLLIPQRATLFGWAALFACLYLLQIKFCTRTVQKLDFFQKLFL